MTTDPNCFAAMENTETPLQLRVAVGSSNPAKIRAVKKSIQRAIDKSARVLIDVQGFSVASQVPDQPFGDEETMLGAKNRAKAAYAAYRDANHMNPHLGIGLEGGLEKIAITSRPNGAGTVDDETLYCMAWMAVYGKREYPTVDVFASPTTKSYPPDHAPVFGLGKTASFPIPDAVASLVRDGVELGEADDKVFGRIESKKGDGLVGLLTRGLIDRSAYYEHALSLSLLPWMQPELYPSGN